jgi:hypothetical protein
LEAVQLPAVAATQPRQQGLWLIILAGRELCAATVAENLSRFCKDSVSELVRHLPASQRQPKTDRKQYVHCILTSRALLQFSGN